MYWRINSNMFIDARRMEYECNIGKAVYSSRIKQVNWQVILWVRKCNSSYLVFKTFFSCKVKWKLRWYLWTRHSPDMRRTSICSMEIIHSTTCKRLRLEDCLNSFFDPAIFRTKQKQTNPENTPYLVLFRRPTVWVPKVVQYYTNLLILGILVLFLLHEQNMVNFDNLLHY